MVLIGNQITAFFEDANQMGLANRTRLFLQEEGIDTVENLVEFTEDKIWRQFIKNCKLPPHVAPVWLSYFRNNFALQKSCQCASI